jgi:hypothetical protein
LARKSSSFDFGTAIGVGVGAFAAWWLYNNWAMLSASVSTALTSASTVTAAAVTPPPPAANLADLQDQAATAQQQANDATAAGNPNATILQTQASNLALAVSEAQADASANQVNAVLANTGLGWINRRNYRRRTA